MLDGVFKMNGDIKLSTSNDVLDPMRNIISEQLMNNLNANDSHTGSIDNGTHTTTITADIEGEVKRKRASDKSYFIAKEILMTEITYKKDLDVINIWFRDEVGKEEPEECSILLTLIAPLAQAHGILVRDLEHRLQNWDGRGGPKSSTEGVADVLLTHLPPLLPIYEEYLDGHILALERLDSAFKSNSRFEQLYRDFETQKVCYLPFTSFVLKPLHRLLQYRNILQSGNRALTVAANCQEEKDRWKEDLQKAVQQARDKADAKVTYLSLKSSSSSDEIMDQCGTDVGTQTRPALQRNNNTIHVCWHRNTSISMKDQLIAVENQLSGYLLRKFKSSNGWQKLWVVFTSFCLFFYKSCLDDFPLACLPLLGYSISAPTHEDNIGKDFVFKLQYKSHVYFFRAESNYTYNRWMEVIGTATQCKADKMEILNDNIIETSPEK